MKIRPVGHELLYADRQGRTDRHDEANGRFSQFCERVFKKKTGYERADWIHLV